MKKLLLAILILTALSCKKDETKSVSVTYKYVGSTANYTSLVYMAGGDREAKDFNGSSYDATVNIPKSEDYRTAYFTITAKNSSQQLDGIMTVSVEGQVLVRDTVVFDAVHPSHTCSLEKFQ